MTLGNGIRVPKVDAPRAAKFPVGFPLLLAGVEWVAPDSLVARKVLIAACYVASVVLVFRLASGYLPALPAKRLSRLFEIKFLNEIGWLPYLEHCLHCRRSGLEKGFFSARQGALLCEACAPHFPDARPLGREPLAVMRYYSRHDLEESLKLGVSRQAEIELKSVMESFLQERLGKTLNSRQFLEKVKPALV